jgi:hypothetical protein
METLEGKTALVTGASAVSAKPLRRSLPKKVLYRVHLFIIRRKALALENALHAMGVKALGYKSRCCIIC